MSAVHDERVFSREEGEEEVTPPYVSKTRSFDSLAVAHVLTGGMAVQEPSVMPPRPRPPSPSSPTLAAAAAGLLDVQRMPSESTNSAVDCLMSLSSLKRGPEVVDDEAAEEDSASKKRPAPDQLQAARRRLKMRTAGVPSPLTRPGNHVRAPARPAPPVQLLSGASVEQLKLLAAAYKLCPTPTPEQLMAIAERVSIAPDALSVWFASRKVLQDWVQQQPHININDLKSMFYGQHQQQEQEAPTAEA